MSTVFELIIDRKLPATIVYENEKVIAIDDIHPVAPVHVLIIPKKAIASLQDVEEGDLWVVAAMVEAAQVVAKIKGVEEGYRLLTNNGPSAGQTVFHLHFHLLGGRILGKMG